MTTAPPRRRQTDRSAETRALLIQATIHCLRASGYAASGTAAIARQAGVTTGALHHHFATKDDLMIGVFDHCNARLGARLQRSAPSGQDSVDVAGVIGHLWEVYGDPEYWTIWEIIIGTRGDPALHARIVQHRLATMHSLVHPWIDRLGISAPADPDAAALMEFLLIAIRGLSLEGFLHQDPAYFQRNLDILADLVSARLNRKHN
jgi:AcrR family transcriptional regulator